MENVTTLVHSDTWGFYSEYSDKWGFHQQKLKRMEIPSW